MLQHPQILCGVLPATPRLGSQHCGPGAQGFAPGPTPGVLTPSCRTHAQGCVPGPAPRALCTQGPSCRQPHTQGSVPGPALGSSAPGCHWPRTQGSVHGPAPGVHMRGSQLLPALHRRLCSQPSMRGPSLGPLTPVRVSRSKPWPRSWPQLWEVGVAQTGVRGG